MALYGKTNIENCKYEYGRDEAIAETIGPIVEALPYGSNCPAFVRIHNELNCMLLQSGRIDIPGKAYRDIEHSRIWKKASPVRLHDS